MPLVTLFHSLTPHAQTTWLFYSFYRGSLKWLKSLLHLTTDFQNVTL